MQALSIDNISGDFPFVSRPAYFCGFKIIDLRIYGIGFFLAFLGFVMLGTMSSCLNDDILMDDSAFPFAEVDTLAFDTVFTTLGSTTEFFLLYNVHDKKMVVDRIYVAGGNDSQYRINVDGVPGNLQENVVIGPNDSLYVFVEVTVDPDDSSTPFLLEDSVMIEYGEFTDRVLLEAYGQNATFYSAVEVFDEVFTDELPIVITRLLYVPPDCTLTLEEGVDMYIRRGASVLIQGNLIVNGTADSLVTFQGLRLEEYFDERAGQWRGIDLLRGSHAEIRHAVIQNSDVGVSLGSVLPDENGVVDVARFDTDVPTMVMENTLIRYQLGSGIFALNSDVDMTNCLVHSSGGNVFNMSYGGTADITNCTFANYGGILDHQNEIVSLANAVQWQSGGDIFDRPGEVNIVNTIIHGSQPEEVAIQDSVPVENELIYRFDHCIIKTQLEANDEYYNNCLLNPAGQDTLFVDRSSADYHLNDDSPARNSGITTANTPFTDLEGKVRDGLTDIGCYEF